ncbi:tigger transposable element-derived protein 1-like [Macrobrachium rosenbergii]|uniref:tigger transposable element-derived protein 1-like n=1 Tax=Macrobrachium rosenbergii TaxID=79674 RepID=UPI0034D7651F
MAPKRQSSSSDASASKKPRKSITMEVKYDVIKRSEKGESNTEIGHALGLSRTMVVTIVKDKQRILKHVQEAAPMKATARANLHNVKLQGEAATADGVAAESFPSGLAEIIREGGYTGDQVFNVDETGLFWKNAKLYIPVSKEKSAPGHKVEEDLTELEKQMIEEEEEAPQPKLRALTVKGA